MYTAQLEGKGTFVIRYPRGKGVCPDWQCPMEEVTVGTGRRLCEGSDVAVLSLGPIGNNVVKAIESLANEGQPISVAHYDMRFAKPLDGQLLQEVADHFSRIITIEDGCAAGGFGSAVTEWMTEHGYHPTIQRLGLPDQFIEHGTVAELQQLAGLDSETIKRTIIGI
jgi:1-deoxy-D-xylulose-5-phosphate synthase